MRELVCADCRMSVQSELDNERQDDIENFEQFYKQTALPDDLNENDTLTIPDYPRMINDAINDFEYYTTEKFKTIKYLQNMTNNSQ